MSIAFAAATALVFPAAQPARAASLSDLKSTLSSLKQQQAVLDQKLTELKGQAQSQQAYLDSLKEKIANAQGQIDNLNSQIDMYDAQISDKQSQIADSEAQIDSDYETLKKRLKLLYMTGEASMLDMIFSADSVQDYFNRSEFVAAIVSHDNAIMETLKNETEAIRAEKQSIEADREALAAVKTEYDAQKAQLESAAAESERVAAQIRSATADAQAQQAVLQQKYDEADRAIEAWWKQYYEDQRRQQEQNNAITGTGTFTWPMPGYASRSNLTQYFGEGYGHRGIDIAGAGIAGQPFVAADSGRVAYVSYNDGIYGIYCIIDHGNGLSTLYGHCSGLAVSAGQNVTKGQTIGYVGMSGIATGYHLHFGVLQNGVPINPLQFFRIG